MKKNNKDANYPVEVYESLFMQEQNHFWFRARNRIIGEVIKNNLTLSKKKTSFVEIGCGTGYVLSYIESKFGFEMVGIDKYKEGLFFASKRTSARLIRHDVAEKKDIHLRFDAGGLFDVIEHIDKPETFLKNCAKLVKKDGMILITVPAYMSLWSKIDEISGHKKRYTKEELSSLLLKCGFKPVMVNYFGMFISAPLFIYRKLFGRFFLERKEMPDQDILLKSLRPPPALLNILYEYSMILESKLVNKIPLPFGSSIIMAARKV